MSTDARRTELKRLISEASRAGQSGDVEGALRLFDEALARYRADRGLEDLVASLFYNKATLMRSQNRAREAIALFDQIIARFDAKQADELMRPWIVLARFNRAVALVEGGQSASGADAFGEFVEHFREDPDSFVRERVARSLLQRSLALEALGRADESRLCALDLVETFAAAAEREIQAVIGGLLTARPEMVGRLPPARHPDRSAFDAEIENEARSALRDDPGLLEEHLAAYRRLRESDLKRESASHVGAAAILTRCQSEGRPFGLLLRSFALQAAESVIPVVQQSHQRLVAADFGYQDSERAVLDLIGNRAPLVGVANPVLTVAGLGDLVPKLAFRNEVWTQGAAALVQLAAFIVVLVGEIADGLALELSLIARAHKEQATLLVLVREGALDEATRLPDDIDRFPHSIRASELADPASAREWLDGLPR